MSYDKLARDIILKATELNSKLVLRQGQNIGFSSFDKDCIIFFRLANIKKSFDNQTYKADDEVRYNIEYELTYNVIIYGELASEYAQKIKEFFYTQDFKDIAFKEKCNFKECSNATFLYEQFNTRFINRIDFSFILRKSENRKLAANYFDKIIVKYNIDKQ